MKSKFGIFTMSAVCILLALPQVASAESPRERAREHFAAGAKFYKAAAYRAAIREFQQADSLDPSALLSFNMGLCHEKLGEEVEAVRLFRVYLLRHPEAPNKDSVEARIAALAASIEKKAAPPYELLEDGDGDGGKAAASAAPTKPVSGTRPVGSGVQPVNNARRLDPLMAGRMPSASATTSVPAAEEPMGPESGPAERAPGPAEFAPGPTEAAAEGAPDSAQGVAPAAGGAVPLGDDRPKPKNTPVYKNPAFWVVTVLGAAILISIAVNRADSSGSVSSILQPGAGNSGGAVLIRF